MKHKLREADKAKDVPLKYYVTRSEFVEYIMKFGSKWAKAHCVVSEREAA